MDKRADINENNEFENQINELKDYQDNMYNQGHWVGTGRVTPFQKNIAKTSPWIMMVIGVIPLIVVIHNFKKSDILSYVYGNSMVILISLIIFISGLVNVIRNIKNRR